MFDRTFYKKYKLSTESESETLKNQISAFSY